MDVSLFSSDGANCCQKVHPNLTLHFCSLVSVFLLVSETSELVHCVTDLQMSNHKLQEEVRKLKQVVEAMEDSNQKLADENEELRNQARV